MSWVTITVEDVKSRFAIDELQALQEEQVGDGQADPIEELIAETVDLVRGYVGVHNSLGDGDTIPAKLRSIVLNIIRYEALNRLGQEATEDRKESYKQAFAVLKLVKDGQFTVAEPEVVDTEEASGKPAPLISSSRSRTLGRSWEDGI